jgi:TetR/AcrR family acrAB operon transcriptional repressor
MMKRVTLPMDEAFGRLDDEAGDPLQVLREAFVDALRRTAGDAQARRVFEIALHKVEYVDEMAAVRESRIAKRDEALAKIARALTRARQRGQIGGRLPAQVAALGLHGLVKGLMQNWMLTSEAFDLVETGGQVIDAYLAGLAA